jgi:hypothetical protein
MDGLAPRPLLERGVRFILVASTIFALLCLVPAPGRAARPLDTDDTGTLEPATLEVELSGDFARGHGDDRWASRVLFALGVVPRLEVRLDVAGVHLDPDDGDARSGLGDSILALKYRFADETTASPAVLAVLALRLPTGDSHRGLGDDGVDVGAHAVVSKQLGPIVLAGNVGHTFVTGDRTTDFWTLSASAEYRPYKAWLVMAEAVSTIAARVADTLVLRAGAVHYLAPRIRLAGAVAAGVPSRVRRAPR